MRKPASDVAGIEEVNAKQDKIGYTPADDSKVLHSTITQLNSTDMNTVLTAGFYQLNSGTNGMPNADAWTIYQVIPLSSTNGVQLAYETNKTVVGLRSWNTIIGVKTFSNWVQFADDSKVAHLSGANNFDTIPTVNNNPLLLASSLPSDLARLSQDANFTAKLQQNGQDVALANNTLARNPNTGSVSEANTFTAAQTFSIAPTIKDASKDKGDNQAATMADLKSVENSAWHQLNNNKYLGGTLLYKIDQSSKTIYLLYSLGYGSYISEGTTIADFSSIVKNIKTISGGIFGCHFEDDTRLESDVSVADLSISSPASIVMSDRLLATDHVGFYDGTYFTYDSLQ
ncbi:pyocin knob domain-containing protein [Lentilactobacillus sp. G22-6]|uniref:pyocin knob domain-containing protein n=1 Tax=Lentilactobacillus dabitei TaxID=2831523 RepID=UPI001C252048|nr:pyocin knob domain-containing protein [Lentilactobacillus dabitei]MBU9788885.1 pyocin knob domain-containing protein [Lentilactobacillus dabitei]